MASHTPLAGNVAGTSSFKGDLSITATIQAVVARRIKASRAARGLTQRELEARLHAVGFEIDQSRIARIERGTAAVAVAEAIGFAVALEVSLESLLVPEEQSERIKVGEIDVDRSQFHQWLAGSKEIDELVRQLHGVGHELMAMRQLYERAVRVLAAAAQTSTNPGVIQSEVTRVDRSNWLREADATAGAYERLSERAAGLCQAARAYLENPLFPSRTLQRLRDAERRLPASQTYRRGVMEGTGAAFDRVVMNEWDHEHEGGRFPKTVRVRLDRLRAVVYPLGDRGGPSMHLPRSDEQWAAMRALAADLSELVDDPDLAATAPAGAGLVRQARQLLELHEAERTRRG